MQDSTCACSKACPSVDPTLRLPHHRFGSLPTQQHTLHMNSVTNTPTIYTQRSTTCAHLQDSTCACSTARPSVDPTLQRPHHRCHSLGTQKHAQPDELSYQHSHYTHTQSSTSSAYIQDSTCECSTVFPSVDPTLWLPQHRWNYLIIQQSAHTPHELTHQHSRNTHRTQHSPCGAHVQDSTCACSTVFPSVDPTLWLPQHRWSSLMTQQYARHMNPVANTPTSR